MFRVELWSCLGFAILAAGCTIGNDVVPTDAGTSPIIDGGFVCISEQAVACLGQVHYSCTRDEEFLSTVIDDCAARTDGHNTCVTELGCSVCRPSSFFCMGEDVVACNDAGTDFEVEETCDINEGVVCQSGRCQALCEISDQDRSYVGCEFYGVDLDNAAIRLGSDASAQQYSIVVSNPSALPTEVVVEENRAPVGEAPDLHLIETLTVLPGDLEIINLPRREVDGSSSFRPCGGADECNVGEGCFCAGGLTPSDPEPEGGHRDCRCRNSAESNGLNDGTHSALTSHAYRLRSVLPIIAYQFNPLDNVGVFSNDASLLLPVSAMGTRYTVVSWPQTIADSDDPNEDFSPGLVDEDLRTFLTIVGSAAGTHVQVTFGTPVRRVIGLGDREDGEPGDVWEFDIGPFDVINLETGGFNADFTGTVVEATHPVGVFVGSEASDAPRFDTVANRQCCADHLEEQIFPNDTLGRRFFIGRMPRRSSALNAAFLDPTRDSVGEFNEPEFIRILGVQEGLTTITTTLPPPDDQILIDQGDSVILTAVQDFEMRADKAVAVLQVLPSQEAVGIAREYPGGDPAIVAVPPAEQYRSDYVFLTPDLYAFDFVTIAAPREASLLLDDVDIRDWGCEVAPADGIERRAGDLPPEWVIYRCQLTFPDVIGLPNVRVEDGDQSSDGYHTLQASEDVSLLVYGFDAFVSYAYAGGLNLDPLD